jgi:hypothetical protein
MTSRLPLLCALVVTTLGSSPASAGFFRGQLKAKSTFRQLLRSNPKLKATYRQTMRAEHFGRNALVSGALAAGTALMVGSAAMITAHGLSLPTPLLTTPIVGIAGPIFSIGFMQNAAIARDHARSAVVDAALALPKDNPSHQLAVKHLSLWREQGLLAMPGAAPDNGE